MQRLWRFLSYNNAVPIAVSIVVLGGASAFAATDPDAVYSATSTVVSVDNTYIANKDLDAYTPRIEIEGVTEDSKNYYVAYVFETIDVIDAVWRDVTKHNTLTVAKSLLGEHTDLGLYAAGQFNDLISHERERLAETQAQAQKAVSTKIVATQYGGLVGKFLDTTTEELPGYVPVIAPEVLVAAADAAETAPSLDDASVSSPENQVAVYDPKDILPDTTATSSSASSTPATTTATSSPPSTSPATTTPKASAPAASSTPAKDPPAPDSSASTTLKNE